jgi:hypothetical protein
MRIWTTLALLAAIIGGEAVSASADAAYCYTFCHRDIGGGQSCETVCG